MPEDTSEGFDLSDDGPSLIDVAVPAYIAITTPRDMLTTVDMSTQQVALLVVIYGDGSRYHVPIPRHMWATFADSFARLDALEEP